MKSENSQKRKKPEVADSMGQAAAMLGVDLEVIAAGKQGCPEAYRNTRIFIEPLREWVIQNQSQVLMAKKKAEIELRKQEADVRLREHRVSVAIKETVKTQDGKRLAIACALNLKKRVQAIPARTAAKLALLTDPLKIEQYLESEINTAFSETAKDAYRKFDCPNCKKEVAV